jgi:transposase
MLWLVRVGCRYASPYRPSQAHDAPMSMCLLTQLKAGTIVLADKAYDADAIRNLITQQGAQPNIPPRSNRIAKASFCPILYKQRNVIERLGFVPCHWHGSRLRSQNSSNSAVSQPDTTSAPIASLPWLSSPPSAFG